MAVETEDPPPFSFSFGFKLALAMAVIVAVISIFTLLVTQNRVNAVYSEFLSTQFEEQAKLFFEKRDARLSAARDAITDALSNVRLVAALQAENYERFNSDLTFELSEILDRYAFSGSPSRAGRAPFFRFIHRDANMEIGTDKAAGSVWGVTDSELIAKLAPLAHRVNREKRDEVGYLTFGTGEEQQLYEILVSPLVDEFDREEYFGSLIFGVPIMSISDLAGGGGERLKNAVMLPDFIFSDQIPAEEQGGYSNL